MDSKPDFQGNLVCVILGQNFQKYDIYHTSGSFVFEQVENSENRIRVNGKIIKVKLKMVFTFG